MRLSIEAARRRLYEIAEDPDADLAEGALCIAAEEYPDLDLAPHLEFLDDLAGSIRSRLPDTPDADAWRRALIEEIHVERGFGGDVDGYYDPRNSFLNEVIDRRRGIPITLAIVYLAAGRRLDLPVAGVNAPGHFLVRHGDTVLDPFDGGRVVTVEDLVARLRGMNAPEPERLAAEVVRVPPDARSILTRVLGNLKANHLRRGDLARALAVVDRIVHLNPGQPQWLRDRGALFQRLDCPRPAIADLERYCILVPDDPETDVIRKAIADLMRNLPPLH